jgi:hypothetical protein
VLGQTPLRSRRRTSLAHGSLSPLALQDPNDQTALITRSTDRVMNVNIPYADVGPLPLSPPTRF